MLRSEWTEYFERLGAQVKNTVTKDTDLLIVGAHHGQRKIEQAYAKGIPMLSWPMCVYLGLMDEREDYLLDVPIKEMTTFIITLSFLTELIYAKIVAGDERESLDRIFRGLSIGTSTVLQSAWANSTPVDQAIRGNGPGSGIEDGTAGATTP